METRTIGGTFASIPIFNMLVPDENPKVITFTADFNNVDRYDINLEQSISQGRIAAVQSVYFDNSRQDEPVIFEDEVTGQLLNFGGRTQGYRALIANKTGIFSLRSVGAGVFGFSVLNVPTFMHTWSATN